MIRSATTEDAAAICAIYNHYIKNSVISFEYEQVSEEEMRNRIQTISDQFPYLVCEEQGQVVAYAYACLWKTREAYKHTLETTVYASPNKLARGAGTRLYQKLFELLEGSSAHVLMAVIALPNDASVALHEKVGFVQTGYFKEVGRKFEKWIDVGYWQKML